MDSRSRRVTSRTIPVKARRVCRRKLTPTFGRHKMVGLRSIKEAFRMLGSVRSIGVCAGSRAEGATGCRCHSELGKPLSDNLLVILVDEGCGVALLYFLPALGRLDCEAFIGEGLGGLHHLAPCDCHPGKGWRVEEGEAAHFLQHGSVLGGEGDRFDTVDLGGFSAFSYPVGERVGHVSLMRVFPQSETNPLCGRSFEITVCDLKRRDLVEASDQSPSGAGIRSPAVVPAAAL